MSTILDYFAHDIYRNSEILYNNLKFLNISEEEKYDITEALKIISMYHKNIINTKKINNMNKLVKLKKLSHGGSIWKKRI